MYAIARTFFYLHTSTFILTVLNYHVGPRCKWHTLLLLCTRAAWLCDYLAAMAAAGDVLMYITMGIIT